MLVQNLANFFIEPVFNRNFLRNLLSHLLGKRSPGLRLNHVVVDQTLDDLASHVRYEITGQKHSARASAGNFDVKVYWLVRERVKATDSGCNAARVCFRFEITSPHGYENCHDEQKTYCIYCCAGVKG